MTGDERLPVHRKMIGWGTSYYYRDRTHVVPRGDRITLCGLPVHDQSHDRPSRQRVCPECAVLWTQILYPATDEPPDGDTDRLDPPR